MFLFWVVELLKIAVYLVDQILKVLCSSRIDQRRSLQYCLLWNNILQSCCLSKYRSWSRNEGFQPSYNSRCVWVLVTVLYPMTDGRGSLAYLSLRACAFWANFIHSIYQLPVSRAGNWHRVRNMESGSGTKNNRKTPEELVSQFKREGMLDQLRKSLYKDLTASVCAKMSR